MTIRESEDQRSTLNIALDASMAFLKGVYDVVSRTKLSVLSDTGIPKRHTFIEKASGGIPRADLAGGGRCRAGLVGRDSEQDCLPLARYVS